MGGEYKPGSKLTIEELTRICSFCCNLKELSMGNMLPPRWDIDYESPRHQLNPESEEYIKDNDFPLDGLCKNLPQSLESLDISQFQLKDRHLEMISERCQKLKVLDITETFITIKSLDTIKDNFPHLSRLSVSSIWIPIEKYQTLFEEGKMPNLKYFWPLKKSRKNLSDRMDDPFGKIQKFKGLVTFSCSLQ